LSEVVKVKLNTHERVGVNFQHKTLNDFAYNRTLPFKGLQIHHRLQKSLSLELSPSHFIVRCMSSGMWRRIDR
jgi:hypothetical protein